MKSKKFIKSIFIFYISAWQVIFISFLSDYSPPNKNYIPDLVFNFSDAPQKVTFLIRNIETKISENLKSFSPQNYFFIPDTELKRKNCIFIFIEAIDFRDENAGLFKLVSLRSPPSLLS